MQPNNLPYNNQLTPAPGAQGAPVSYTQAPIQPTPGQPQPGQSNQNTPSQPVIKNPNSTQNTLQFSEIRDGIVIMNDGSFRAVVACKSINFDLMSDREREGVEYSYQNFLNSLNFPIQILVRSQRVDIGPYIDKLVSIRRSQDNMLLGVLMDDYINFIDVLSQEANIMEKTFFIVIPFFSNGDGSNFVEQGKGFFGKLFSPKQAVTHINASTYQKAKDELKNRIDSAVAGLFQIGIQSAPLSTKALGELYYNYYNPDTAVRQPLVNFNDTTTTYVKKAPDTSSSAQGAYHG